MLVGAGGRQDHDSGDQAHCERGEHCQPRDTPQVLEAVHDLHSRRIVHRDLKPENLLFYDNTHSSKVLVVDFGLSDYEEELNKDSPVCGTATYLAPEVSLLRPQYCFNNVSIFKYVR